MDHIQLLHGAVCKSMDHIRLISMEQCTNPWILSSYQSTSIWIMSCSYPWSSGQIHGSYPASPWSNAQIHGPYPALLHGSVYKSLDHIRLPEFNCMDNIQLISMEHCTNPWIISSYSMEQSINPRIISG